MKKTLILVGLFLSFCSFGQVPVSTDSTLSERRIGLKSFPYAGGGSAVSEHDIGHSVNPDNLATNSNGSSDEVYTYNFGGGSWIPRSELTGYRNPDLLFVDRAAGTITNDWAETSGSEGSQIWNENPLAEDRIYTFNATFTSLKKALIKPGHINGRMIFVPSAGFSIKAKTSTGYVDTSLSNMPDGVLIDSTYTGAFYKRGNVLVYEGYVKDYYSSNLGPNLWPQETFDDNTDLFFNNGSSGNTGVGIVIGSGSPTSSVDYSIYASVFDGTAKTYRVTYDSRLSSGTGNGYVGYDFATVSTDSDLTASFQTKTFDITTNTYLFLAFSADSGTTVEIDNVFVQEITE